MADTGTPHSGTIETLKDFGDEPEGIANRWVQEIDLSEKERKDYDKRCRAINKSYRDERIGPNQQPVSGRKFNLFWSNIQTLEPVVYARTPKADVQRRFKDGDPVGRLACEIAERSLDYFIGCDDSWDRMMRDIREDFLLFAQGVSWQRYVPHFHSIPNQIPVFPTSPEIADEGLQVTNNTEFDEFGQYKDDKGTLYAAEDVQEDEEEGFKFVLGPPTQEVEYEEVADDYVNRADFGYNAGARTWAEVYAVWRIVYMTRAQLHQRFDATIGEDMVDQIPLDYAPTDSQGPQKNGANVKDIFKRAAVYEIWDKSTKTVIWVCKAAKAGNKKGSLKTAPGLLDIRRDPLKLSDFFPCPRPVFGTQTNDTIIPIPDYVYYQDQCAEINGLTTRIDIIEKAIIVRGAYAGNVDAFRNILTTAGANDMIPVDQAQLMALGLKSLADAIWFWPIDVIIQALKACIEMRDKLIQDVYQITGMSDIIRGSTDPNETATAQQIKSQWGSLRVRDKQHEIQRYARDDIRIKFEIIFNHFEDQSIWTMTNAEAIPDIVRAGDDAAQAFQKDWMLRQQALIQQQQQMNPLMGHNGGPPMGGNVVPMAPGMPQAPAPPPPQPTPPPPEMVEQAKQQGMQQAFGAAMGLLRNKALRHFRVDIETDSTVVPDENAEKQRGNEFLTAFGTLLMQSTPILEKAPEFIPVVGEAMIKIARIYRFGNSFESSIETAIEQLKRRGANPQGDGGKAAEAQAKMAETQVQKLEVAQRAQETQINANVEKRSQDIDAGRLALESLVAESDPRPQVTV